MIFEGRLFKPGARVVLSGQTFTTTPDVPGLRIAFTCERSITPTPDTVTVSIANVDELRRNAMQSAYNETGRATLQLWAGYEGQLVQLFGGDVRSMNASKRNGPTVRTEATADDGGDAITDVPLTGVSAAGLTASTMITVALAAMAKAGHPITPHASVAAALAGVRPAATTSVFNVVSVGKARDLLDQAARTLNTRWYVRNGELHLVRKRLPVDPVAIVLPRKVWLSELDRDGSDLATLSVLMDANLVPGRSVRVDGASFRIERARYAGDTKAGPWSVRLALREVTA